MPFAVSQGSLFPLKSPYASLEGFYSFPKGLCSVCGHFDSPDSGLRSHYENFVLLLKILILVLKDQILLLVWLNQAI